MMRCFIQIRSRCTFRPIRWFHPVCEICVFHAVVTHFSLFFSLSCEYFGLELYLIVRKSLLNAQGWGDWNSIEEYVSFVFDNFATTFADAVTVVLVIWKLSDKSSPTGKHRIILAGKTMIHMDVIPSPQGIDHTQYKCRRQCVPCIM